MDDEYYVPDTKAKIDGFDVFCCFTIAFAVFGFISLVGLILVSL